MQNKKPLTSPTLLINILAFAACLFIMVLNGLQLSEEVRSIAKVKKVVPYSFLGHKFLGLDEILKDVTVVGYYTDKNMDEFEGGAQYAQAQLLLAPKILDFNNLEHEFVLFDCRSPELAFRVIKENGLVALKKNQFGIILAKGKQ